ncbi:MAG TPA: alpha/beta hydrolase [Polyangiaceae bacterium]
MTFTARGAFLATVAILGACHEGRPASSTTGATSAPQIDDRMVDVGGRRLHVHCMGSGEPTVVMEAGHGESGDTWRRVQPEIAKVTRACAYDRAGFGSSDKPAKPHAVADTLQDLRVMLPTAGIKAPYVFVGHSLGGLLVRLYAAAHPGEMAGLVLVDATTEDEDLKLWPLISPDAFKMVDPDGTQLADMRTVMAQLRANRSIGDKPLVVLTAGIPEEPPPGVSPEPFARIAQEMQAELPQISSNSTQIVAARSHHFIQLENPELVVSSVRQVVDAVRTHGRVDGSALAPLANEAPLPE